MTSMNKYLLTSRIIVGAMVMSTCIYFVVLMTLSQQWTEPAPDLGIIPMTLMGLSIAMIPMVAVLRKVVMGSLALTAPPAARAKETVSEAALEDAVRKAAMRYQVGTLVGVAIAESIAIYGFVTAFLTQEPLAYLPNWGVAVAMMAIQFPRPAGLMNLLGEPERTTLAGR